MARTLRNSHLFLILGIVLLAIAFVARSGLFSRKNPGEPANRYMREALALPKPQKLSPEEAAIIDAKYGAAVVRPSGLRYIIRTQGMGDKTPKIGQEVTVLYVGRLLLTGAKFDSSYDRGQPFVFQVGLGQVIPGWDATVLDMKKGENRTVVIPWWLAYGENGESPDIPPKASLVFEIRLIDFH